MICVVFLPAGTLLQLQQL